jgi:flagellar motor switch protein FliM
MEDLTMATYVALKCLPSKELLNYLEKGIRKLDLEADSFLSKLDEKSEEVPSVSTDCATNNSKGTISFRVPRVVKGPKNKRLQSGVEKNTTKKKKNSKKKGTDPTFSRQF